MRQTREGADLVEFAMKTWQNKKLPWPMRWAAFLWLSDRGLGRPMQTIELAAALETVGAPPKLDLSVLSRDERQALRGMVQRASGRLPKPPTIEEVPVKGGATVLRLVPGGDDKDDDRSDDDHDADGED